MGNRTFQYFLNWVKDGNGPPAETGEQGQDWIDRFIYSFIAVGPPFLGAPKALRSTASGDRLGLEGFLSEQEGLTFGRTIGTGAFLYPVGDEYFLKNTPFTTFFYLTKTEGAEKKLADFQALSAEEGLLEAGAQIQVNWLKNYYQDNPYYGGAKGQERVLSAPPVKRMYAIYGVNLDTELLYFYKKATPDSVKLYSHVTDSFPGYKSRGGILFETSNSPQKCILDDTGLAGTRSGDGTVPYASLSFCKKWRSQIPDLKITEVEKADHRQILNTPYLFKLLIEYIARAPESKHAVIGDLEHPLKSNISSPNIVFSAPAASSPPIATSSQSDDLRHSVSTPSLH